VVADDASVAATVAWYMRHANESPVMTSALYSTVSGKIAHSVMHAAMSANC